MTTEPKPEPTPQEELVKEIEEFMDLMVKLRSKAYNIDMKLRACRKCIANGGKP